MYAVILQHRFYQSFTSKQRKDKILLFLRPCSEPND